MKRLAPPALFALAAALPAACSSFDFLTDVGDARQPAAEDCGECHVAIYDEFRASSHADAWVGPGFLDATADHAIKDCLGCHAPESIYTDGPPVLRATRREEGVTCLSCHFDGGAMVGPEDSSALAEPHPVLVGRAIYRSSLLCGKCHEGTYREWQEATDPDGETCQDCHMERVTRTSTQATSAISTVLVAFEDEFEGRRHTFHVPLGGTIDDAVSAVIDDVRRDEETTRCDLILTNDLPHLMPTGDFGFRWLKITTAALPPSGSTLSVHEESLFNELGQSLVPGVARRLAITVPSRARALRVTVTTGKRSGPRAIIFEKTFALP